jgi:hypothetical protein
VKLVLKRTGDVIVLAALLYREMAVSAAGLLRRLAPRRRLREEWR